MLSLDRLALTVLVVAAAGAACRETAELPRGATQPSAVRVATEESAARLVRGERLFREHCTACHGSAGDGRGIAAPYLLPPARDLVHGRLRLVSGRDGDALEADLVATLRRGTPGSAMPSWSWLGETALWDLAAYVRGMAAERSSAARELDIPPAHAILPVHLERGARLYTQHCAACHREDGTGAPEPRFDERGELDWARDFTAGLLKGGAGREELWRRIRLGLPGTAMGPTPLADDDTEALVAHVRGMIPPGNSERFVQERRQLVAKRIHGPLPDATSGGAWELADEIRVVLAPLRSSAASVRELRLAALHDGASIAIRARWDDATTALDLLTDSISADALALEFSDEAAPPLFGMGSAEHPVAIWHWRSLRLSEIAGATDLLDATPHLSLDERASGVRADAQVYRRSEGVPPVSRTAERLDARGIASVPATPRASAEARVLARASERGWEVVFVRALAPTASSDIAFTPGVPLQIACAAWNRAAGDARGQKSVSIWQELVLEP